MLTLILSLIASLSAFASTTKPESKFTAQALYVGQLNPSLKILYGINSRGSKVALISDGEKIRTEQGGHTQRFHDGEIVELSLSNGERLFLPRRQNTEAQMSPALIHTDKAPHYLQEVELTQKRLEEFGFSNFAELEQVVAKARPSRVLLKNSSDMKLVLVRTRLFRPEQHPLFNDQDVRALWHGENIFKSSYDHSFVLVRANRLAEFIETLNLANEVVEVFEPEQMFPDISLSESIHLLGKSWQKSLDAVNSLAYEEDLSNLPDSTKEYITNEVTKLLSVLQKAYGQVNALIDEESLSQTSSSNLQNNRNEPITALTQKHPLRRSILIPLHLMGNLCFRVLHKLRHPWAQDVLIEGGIALDAAGISHLVARNPAGIQFYFPIWIKNQLAKMRLVDRLPDHQQHPPEFRDLELRMAISPLDFLKLKLQELKLSHTNRPVEAFVPRLTKGTPLLAFGLPQDPDMFKSLLIDFIIKADKESAKLAQWVSKYNLFARTDVQRTLLHNDVISGFELNQVVSEIKNPMPQPKGAIELSISSDLSTVLYRMATHPANSHFISDFSLPVYQANMLDVFADLMEIADTALINPGTIAAVMDSSLSLISRATDNATRDPRIMPTSLRLQNAIQQFQARRLSALSHRHDLPSTNACEFLFSGK